MGAPKRNRKKFEKPKERWNLERIKSDNSLKDEYGLKNMRELWKVQTEISRIRGNVRELLSGKTGSEEIKEKIIERLTKLGVANQTTTLDNLLDIKESDLLNRRLQTVVYKKGLARTIKQSRQITVHGFIAINGKRVNRPGYMVGVHDESQITYYKPIDVAPPKPKTEPQSENTETNAQPQEAANA